MRAGELAGLQWRDIDFGGRFIRDQLGHFSIQMTVDIYGHLVPGANRSAVDRLDDVPVQRIEIRASKESNYTDS